ncbi:helix-turn-helix transcriptional regulator [Ruegeria hyattellae]|uniref:helix-turn-helix transcriptional regulator n=1 Tax=Ruegeria hyattellae TaxID=3233337 RepID=UPI00355BCC9C
MNNLIPFAVNLLDCLSELHDDEDRWELVLTQLASVGFNALNILCFSPESGDIHWVRSSMSKDWLELYDRSGSANGDPMLAQVRNGTESLYVRAASLRNGGRHSEKVVALNHGLKSAGYMHLYSLVVPCPENEAKLVVISSDRPDADDVMRHQQREMRILATVLATNLGADMPSDHGRVYDIADVLLDGPRLTKREIEVLGHLAQGHRNDRIAEMLGLSEITVRTHIRSARDKLDAPTREAALVRAVQLGLIG